MLDVRGHQWLYFLVYLQTFLRADASPDVPITIIHDAVNAGAGVSFIAYRFLCLPFQMIFITLKHLFVLFTCMKTSSKIVLSKIIYFDCFESGI